MAGEKYKSVHTGAEIDEAVRKVKDGEVLSEEAANSKFLKLSGGGVVSGDVKVQNPSGLGMLLHGNNIQNLENEDLYIASTDETCGGVHIINRGPGYTNIRGGGNGLNLYSATGPEISVGSISAPDKITVSMGGIGKPTDPCVITGLADPVEDADAANKKYVDAHSGLTKDEAKNIFLPLEGGKLEKNAIISAENGEYKFDLSYSGLNFEHIQSDGHYYFSSISSDVIGWGDINSMQNYLGDGWAQFGSVFAEWKPDGEFDFYATRITGIPTVTDEDDPNNYIAQRTDAASVGYVRDALDARIGEINTVLDKINGDVI